jgi:hypothetical protein
VRANHARWLARGGARAAGRGDARGERRGAGHRVRHGGGGRCGGEAGAGGALRGEGRASGSARGVSSPSTRFASDGRRKFIPDRPRRARRPSRYHARFDTRNELSEFSELKRYSGSDSRLAPFRILAGAVLFRASWRKYRKSANNELTRKDAKRTPGRKKPEGGPTTQNDCRADASRDARLEGGAGTRTSGDPRARAPHASPRWTPRRPSCVGSSRMSPVRQERRRTRQI